MLIILPVLTFAMLFLTILGVQSRRQETLAGARAAFLETAAFLGGYMLIYSEFLSLFKLLVQPWVSLSWGLAFVGVGWFGWRKGLLSDGLHRLRSKWQRPERFDVVAGILLALILMLLLLTALIAPSNNNDSLRYHMSRIVHWAQNGDLNHYATGYLPQLMHPIGAELIILNLRLLWGNDTLANLAQWLSLVGVLIGVSGIAKRLGASKRGQWLGVAFAVSLPIGLLEATSTQNDYVTAFWLVSLLYTIFLSNRRNLYTYDALVIGLTLGLGILTKTSFYFYAFLPMVYYSLVRIMKVRQRKILVELVLIVAVAGVMNLGYWSRNHITFGSIFGQKDFIAGHMAPSYGPGQVIGGVVRNVAQNFPTPSDEANAKVVNWLISTFSPIDSTMRDFSIEWAWNHEDLAGNPVHAVFCMLTVVVLLVNRRKFSEKLSWHLLVILLGSYLILSSVIKYDLYGVRYQLPFFVAWAPLFGIAIGSIGKKGPLSGVVVLLLLSVMPWVLFNRTRPLIAMRDSSDPFTIPCLAGCTTGSILNEPSSSIVFGTLASHLRGPYTQAVEAIEASGCRNIGLRLDSSSPEYLFWWLLEAPQSGYRLETIHTYPELERYLDPGFKPCAIICTICRRGDYIIPRLHGLDLAGDYTGMVQLYFGDHYEPDPGD